MKFHNSDHCFNCKSVLNSGDEFCGSCGQKRTTGKITVFELLEEFMSNTFNLDSKLIRTGMGLLVPGKLTKEYFQGKHKSYTHPMRLFFVAAIFFFALLGFNLDESPLQVGLNESDNPIDQGLDMFKDNIERNRTYLIVDSLKEEVIKDFSAPEVAVAMDSLMQALKSDKGESADNSLSIGDGVFEIKGDTILIGGKTISQDDFLNLEPREVVEKCCSELPFWQKVLARQGIKMTKDGQGLVQYLLGKLPLMILLMMPFLALILKVVYFRRNQFYVEHLFFSFHLHAFVFSLGTIILIALQFTESPLLIVLVLSIFVYLLLALKNVYQQGWIKTIFKFIFLCFSYMVLSVFFLILSFMISFLLF